MSLPTLAAATAYLGDTSWGTPEITDAFASELRAQARACRIPAPRAATVDTTTGSPVVVHTPAVVGETRTFGAADVGAAVTGSGIPAATVVVSVDGDYQVTLSANATATAAAVSVTLDPDRSDLNQALYRRVAHNLALRNLPLGLEASISESAVATNRVGGLDAEVARLEAPFRKLVVG